MRTIAVFLILSTISVLLWSGEGAYYIGADQRAANAILEYSQQHSGYGNGVPGHPRDHVRGSVEKASKRRGAPYKNGFFTKNDQNEAAHRFLTYVNAHNLMAPIHSAAAYRAFRADPTGGFEVPVALRKVEVVVSSADLGYNTDNNIAVGQPRPPRVGRWIKGVLNRDFEMTGVKAVLQHRRGMELTGAADVHVQTLYPTGPGVVTTTRI